VTNYYIESMFEIFTPDQIVERTGLTSDEVINSFRLSLRKESLTEQYSETCEIRVEMFSAHWSKNYVVGSW
jgi:hypothetical protein